MLTDPWPREGGCADIAATTQHMTYIEAQGSHSYGPIFGIKINANNLKSLVIFIDFY